MGLPLSVPTVVDGAEAVAKQEWRLGNEQLELQFQRKDNQVVAHQLVNKISGRTIPITEDDFSLGIEGRKPLSAADFAFQEAADERIPGGRRLTLHLAGKAPSARLDVIYELGDRDFFLRRRLELVPTGPLPLREVDMWRVGLEGECSFQECAVPIYLQLGPEWRFNDKHQGFGFPVFLEDTFWGLEYPAGYNHYEKGLMTLRHFPGRTVADRFVSKTAVLGVAEPGQAARRFRQYLDSVMGARSTPPLFFAWKTWVTLMPPTEANCLAIADDFRRNLHDATGARFDSFALDDGWDKKDSLWDIDAGRFPRGFEPLIAALQPMETGLGLWMSPSTGYGHADWGAAQGYKKNAWTWLLCQSDPNYRRDMVKAVTGLAKKYNVNYFKFDGFCAPCDAEGHNHHLPGNYAKEANTDAYLELLAAVRKTQRGSFINLTTGVWASPWWLQYADSVWDQVYDGWPPGIAPTPELAYSQITDRDAVFRKRCRENPWFPPEALEDLGVWAEDYNFMDEQIMTVLGRGCRLISFYVDPRRGAAGERDWIFLGSAINWARHNGEILRHTRMILGDPMEHEPYGYAHFQGERGILVLRNPFVTPQTVKIKLDESAGWVRVEAEKNDKRPLVARIVYPYHQTLPSLLHYGDELTAELNAYETLFIHVAPLERSGTVFLGARYEEAERSGNNVSCTVYGRPGEQLLFPIAGATQPSKVRWNGRLVAPTTTPHGLELPLVMEGTPQTCRVEGGKLSTQATDEGWRITGNCVAAVPEGTRATMHLLWALPVVPCPQAAKLSNTSFQLIDDAAEKQALRQQAAKLADTKPRCSATVNGAPAKVAVVNSKLYNPTNVGDHRLYAEYPPAAWVWFKFDIPAGRSEVAVAVECPKGDAPEMQAKTGWWLWTENPLRKGTLTLSYDKPLPSAAAEPLPLATRMELQRRILALRPLTAPHIGE
jgi:hypothetical protein